MSDVLLITDSDQNIIHVTLDDSQHDIVPFVPVVMPTDGVVPSVVENLVLSTGGIVGDMLNLRLPAETLQITGKDLFSSGEDEDNRGDATPLEDEHKDDVELGDARLKMKTILTPLKPDETTIRKTVVHYTSDKHVVSKDDSEIMPNIGEIPTEVTSQYSGLSAEELQSKARALMDRLKTLEEERRTKEAPTDKPADTDETTVIDDTIVKKPEMPVDTEQITVERPDPVGVQCDMDGDALMISRGVMAQDYMEHLYDPTQTPNCRNKVIVHQISPSFMKYRCKNLAGQDIVRFPAIVKATNDIVILEVPFALADLAVVFRDCPEFKRYVPLGGPSQYDWCGNPREPSTTTCNVASYYPKSFIRRRSSATGSQPESSTSK